MFELGSSFSLFFPRLLPVSIQTLLFALCFLHVCYLHRNSSCPTLCPLTFCPWIVRQRMPVFSFFPTQVLKSAMLIACIINSDGYAASVETFISRWRIFLKGGSLCYSRYIYGGLQQCVSVYFAFVQYESYSPINLIIVLFAEIPSPAFSVPEELMQFNCSL